MSVAPRSPSDSSLGGETHWDVPEGSDEKLPQFVMPQRGLETRSEGHGRSRVVVPVQRDDRLGIAAQKNDILKVKKLLKKGADPNVHNPASGVTPLGVAAERGHIEIMQLLLAAKSSVNSKTNDGLTALHICCQFGMVETATILINARAEINTVSGGHVPCGTTPLVAATIRNSLPVMRVLLDAHADVNLSNEGAGGNPLHLACQLGHSAALKALLATGTADVTRRNRLGDMPIETALSQGYTTGIRECTELLRPLNAALHACPFEETPDGDLAELMAQARDLHAISARSPHTYPSHNAHAQTVSTLHELI